MGDALAMVGFNSIDDDDDDDDVDADDEAWVDDSCSGGVGVRRSTRVFALISDDADDADTDEGDW